MIAGRVHFMHHQLLVSMVHKIHPTPDDTINNLEPIGCAERTAKRINRERCASPCAAHPMIWRDFIVSKPERENDKGFWL